MIENSQFSITILLIDALIRFLLIGTHFALCPTLNGKVRELWAQIASLNQARIPSPVHLFTFKAIRFSF